MKNKDYKVVTWSDGFARWHATVIFLTPLGNTPKAEAIAHRALKAGKVAIRREITERMNPNRCKRLSYVISANSTEPGTGRLEALTISEQ